MALRATGTALTEPNAPCRLAEPEKQDGRPDFAAETARYHEYLARQDVPRPYRVSAGLGHDILADQQSPLDLATDQVTLFERLTRYLQPTDSFRQARFLRFLRLAARGDDADLAPDRDGVVPPEGRHQAPGTTYTLELFHHQPIDVTAGEPFTMPSTTRSSASLVALAST